MAKKTLRLNDKAVKKGQGYIPSGLNSLTKDVKDKTHEDKCVRINFEVSEKLRRAFKAKLAQEGKKARIVFVDFMMQYVQN